MTYGDGVKEGDGRNAVEEDDGRALAPGWGRRRTSVDTAANGGFNLGRK